MCLHFRGGGGSQPPNKFKTPCKRLLHGSGWQFGNTPLKAASIDPTVSTLKALLAAGADVNRADDVSEMFDRVQIVHAMLHRGTCR